MMSGFSTRLRCCAVAILALSLAAAAPAQTKPSDKSQSQTSAPSQQIKVEKNNKNGNSQFIIPLQVNEVDLVFTVTDKHGHFINNLKESDFALLDNQLAPKRVFSFSQQTDLPLRLGVLIDTSTSIRRRFHFEQQASIAFLLQTLRPDYD